MLALSILKHAFLQVVGNLRQLVNISLLPILVQFFGTIFVVFTFMRGMEGESGAPGFFAIALVVAVLMLPFVWTAVNWHRYVLLNEPQPIFPNLPLNALIRYIVTGILIGLLIVVPGIVAVAIVQALAQMLGVGGMIFTLAFGLALMLAILVISLRLSTAFPGAAIGTPNPIATAWRETAGYNRTFLLLSILMILLQLPVNLLEYIPIGPTTPAIVSIFLSLLTIVVLWIYMFISLSVLTTLYGHFVEKRPLRTQL